MNNEKERKQQLFELSSAIAALTNQQCHWDLANDDPLLLNVKLEELKQQFNLLRRANSD